VPLLPEEKKDGQALKCMAKRANHGMIHQHRPAAPLKGSAAQGQRATARGEWATTGQVVTTENRFKRYYGFALKRCQIHGNHDKIGIHGMFPRVCCQMHSPPPLHTLPRR